MKKFLAAFAAILLTTSVVSCTASESEEEGQTLIRVAASATPMIDAVQAAAEAIDSNYAVELVETTGYFTPNIILNDGEIDANFIQHRPHMEDFNEANGGTLEVVAPIYFVVGAYFSREYESLQDLPDAAEITIPNESNQGRALELLQSEGLIVLDDKVPEFEATLEDIVQNPKEFRFTEVDLMNLNVAYEEADAIFSLGSFARQIGLYPETDGLASESDERFAVSLVARADRVDSPEIQALKEAFTSGAVRETLEGLDQVVAF